jgi:hypothetical protein
MPRIRAVGFAVDFGLDVYALVMLVSTRWWVQLAFAIMAPYTAMSLLLGPGILQEERSKYASGILATCLCSVWCWPAIWWFDVRMVCSLLGVQLPCCGESKVALPMYTELRMLFEAVVEALPSALVSSAVLYDKLGVQSTVYAIPTAVLHLNLASSFLRGAVEVWRFAVLTHAQGNCCFMTTIADMVWDMLPEAPQSPSGRPVAQCPGHTAASAFPATGNSSSVTVAPKPMTLQQHGAQPKAVVQGTKLFSPVSTSRKGFAWVLFCVWLWMLFQTT